MAEEILHKRGRLAYRGGGTGKKYFKERPDQKGIDQILWGVVTLDETVRFRANFAFALNKF